MWLLREESDREPELVRAAPFRRLDPRGSGLLVTSASSAIGSPVPRQFITNSAAEVHGERLLRKQRDNLP